MLAAAPVVLLVALAASSAPPAAGPVSSAARTGFDHVVLVSVDGCRPDAIDGPEDGPLPGFRRVLRGPHTLQARADADTTVTVPNHVSMVTGRPVAGPSGHGWRENTDPPAARHGGTLHKQAGAYVSSMFDVAHDHGLATAAVVTKPKFAILAQSFDAANGAPDATGTDDGRGKIDLYACARTSRMAREATVSWLRSGLPRSLTLLHFAAPDAAGHGSGWDMAPGSAYRKGIAEVDAELDALLAAIDADDRLRGKVAVVLTADHGGGVPARNHTEAREPVNFLVPLAVWLGADGPSVELAAANADTRTVLPADRHAGNDITPPPIRTAEAGNVALQLLGLPPIPGSVANARQDLRLGASP